MQSDLAASRELLRPQQKDCTQAQSWSSAGDSDSRQQPVVFSMLHWQNILVNNVPIVPPSSSSSAATGCGCCANLVPCVLHIVHKCI